MTEDQRQDPRLAARQKIWCEGQDSIGAAETHDVSRSGMFILTDRPPEIGTQLSVRFSDHEGEVALQMEVVWRGSKAEHDKTGVGMRIVSFEQGKDVYERFLKRQAAG